MKTGINTANLDTSVSPRQDFYHFADGGWIKEHPLKGEYASFGMFDYLRDNAREQLKDLILTLGENPDAKIRGSIAQKVNDVYRQVLDIEPTNELGVTPILPYLDKIERDDLNDFTKLLVWEHFGYGSAFFSSGVTIDAKDSSAHIFCFGEGGLTLGDRDYYLEDNENNRKILAAMETYVKRLMQLSGFDAIESERVWQNVIKLERLFAENKHTREQRRDPNLRYNIFTVDELKKRYPVIDWDQYFAHLEVSPDKVDIANPQYLDFINDLIPTLTEREIKDYMLYDVISDASSLLGEDFEDANFQLYDRVMSGVEEKKPRWKKAMNLANSIFGEAIGELYVAKYFPAENKDYMKGLVENLRAALADHIRQLSWMSENTKSNALEKLDAMTVKIGYPDRWKDYSEISIDPDKSLWENVFNASLWFIRDNLKKLCKPVDKEEWHMYPQTVNAYYSPINNEICFPAAILQPPYFDIKADDALNYGAIGVVIGHEMTHGFDDQGRQFDKNGNLCNWWSAEDEKRFNELADKLVRQFDAVEVAPGIHANGRFTLGENIADQGGLRVALTAYDRTQSHRDDAKIGDFSPLQRFYISYAQVWAGSIRDEEILSRTKTDPHSLAVNRVNVTLKNIDEFLQAFDIREGDAMYHAPQDRVTIW